MSAVMVSNAVKAQCAKRERLARRYLQRKAILLALLLDPPERSGQSLHHLELALIDFENAKAELEIPETAADA